MTDLKKTIVANYDNFEAFFTEAKKYVLKAFPTSQDKVSFHFVAYQ